MSATVGDKSFPYVGVENVPPNTKKNIIRRE